LEEGHPSPPATIPEGSTGRVIALLFGLAPGGVYLASRSPDCRWSLTPPFHPYPARPRFPYGFEAGHASWRGTHGSRGGMFLWHFPWSHLRWALPSTLPCGARTFLRHGQAMTARPCPRPLDLLTQTMIARPVEGVKARHAPDSQSILRVPAHLVYFGRNIMSTLRAGQTMW